MRKSHAYQASFIAIAAATLLGGSAFAQTAPAPAKDGATQGLEEVVVVARRTEERLQDVPVTVTAVSAQTLKETQIQSGTDLIKLVPSLSVQQESTVGGPNFAIRGIRDGVVSYFNDIPVNTMSINDQIWDLSSVQALAGPQGTLFGQNATGGAILFVAQRPTKTFGGYVDAQYGNYNYEQLNAVLNIPVNDMLQVRLGGRLVKHDPMVENIGGGPGMDAENRYQFRASALFEPTATITNYTVFDYSNRNETPITQIASFIAPGGIPASIYGDSFYEAGQAQNARGIRTIDSPFPAYNKTTTYGVSNVFTDVIGHGLTFKYILGYRHTDATNFMSETGLPMPAEVLLGADKGDVQWTNEIQLLGKMFNDRLSWTAGLFDLQQHNNAVSDTELFAPVGQPFGQNDITHFTADKSTTEAAYIQGTYAITDKLNFTAGVRYTKDTASTAATGFQPEFFFAGPPVCGLPVGGAGVDLTACTQNQSLSSDAITYNFSLDYHFTRGVMAYATARRGYNHGGFNASAPPNSPPGVPQATYLPEYVSDYEIGTKTEGTLAGMPVRANLSIYESLYTQIQRSSSGITPDGATFSGITNGPKATIYGVSLESVLRPVHDFTINFNYGYLHTEYTEGAPGFPAGNIFGQAPVHTINLSGNYRHDLAQGGAAVATISYTYQSSETFADSNVGVAHAFQPAYGVADARIGWESIMNSPVDVTFFVKNLTDAVYAVDIQDLSSLLGYTGTVYNDPRTYGIEVHYRFGG